MDRNLVHRLFCGGVAEEALPVARFGLITCNGFDKLLRDELDLRIGVRFKLSSISEVHGA